MRSLILALICFPFFLKSQYCIPTQGAAAVAPVITKVVLGEIDNSSGFGLTNYGYSDYTDLSTPLSVGEVQSITVETGDFFPHNIGIWIDFDRNGLFTADESIDKFEIGGSNPKSKTIEFELPEYATNGMTRLRVRGMLEPFGPWSLSIDPCLPASGDGETEDYSIEIVNGIQGSVGLAKLNNLQSKINIGEEDISFEIRNYGNIPVSNINATFLVDNNLIFSETIENQIDPDSSFQYTFSSKYDFMGIDCSVISVEITSESDENPTDNYLEKQICNLTPLKASHVWYLHSNINGGIEPLGGDPFYSTTNVTTMNNVFGENMWKQEYFETADISKIFSDSSCVVFLDGSFDHNLALEVLLENHAIEIESWVASGGKLFLNSAIETSADFYMPLGFDDTYATFYQVSFASISSNHPVIEGPFQPLSENLTGFYYANDVIQGENLDIIAFETNDIGLFNAPTLHLPILAEKIWGEGKVIFGGLTPSQLVAPEEASMNLRANVLEYLNECDIVSSALSYDVPQRIEVFPNPVTDYLHINNMQEQKRNATLVIYNISGQIVQESQINLSNKIDVSSLPSGYYQIAWKGNIHQPFTKFVKL